MEVDTDALQERKEGDNGALIHLPEVSDVAAADSPLPVVDGQPMLSP